MRLTLIYAALFLAAGSLLLALTYGLVANSLRHAATGAQPKATVANNSKFVQLCKQPPKSKIVPDKVSALCKNAFAAGANTASQAQRVQTLHHLLIFSLIGLGVMTIVSAGLGWIMAGRVLRPIRTITETARRASEAHLGERLALAGPRDELRELGDTFDQMLERLDTAFTAQRRFVANASHELRTPLTIMRTAIDVTLAKPVHTDEQIEIMAGKVRRSIDRAETTIDALLTLAISDQGPVTHEVVDLATAAEDALDNASAAIADLHLHVAAVLEPAETVGDTQLLERMVANLVDNAVCHNIENGWIHVRTATNDGDVMLEISNSGQLVASDLVPSLFEPFRRGAGRTGTRNGVGLGLSIVQSIAGTHAATVAAHSQPNGGLNISARLPRPPSDDTGIV
jgi:signal transduction histidine kinase